MLERADIDNFWQSVTGSLRWGENPCEAAVRELGEETGITAVGQLEDWDRSVTFEILDAFRSRYAPQVTQNLEHMFSLKVPYDQPVVLNPEEHLRYAWVAHAEAVDLVWSWSNRQAIQKVAAKYWLSS